jgi:hypothetical protein
MLISDFGGDTIDTREEANRPGPFCDGLAVLLHFSDSEDEAYGDFCVYGTGRRFGRRVLWCDTQGFMATERFSDEAEASLALRSWAQTYDNDEWEG